MGVQGIHKCLELLLGVGPNPPNVVQVAEVVCRSLVAFGEDGLFPGSHVNVSIGRGKAFAHGRSLDLEVVFAIKLKVVSGETEMKEF